MKAKTLVLLACLLAASPALAETNTIEGTWSCVTLNGAPVTNKYASIVITFSTNGLYRDETQQWPGVVAINEDKYRVDGEYIRFGEYTDDRWNLSDATIATNYRTGEVTTNYSRANESRKHALHFAVTNDGLLLKDARGSASEYRRTRK